jgi:hypothetical protein
MGGVYVRRVHAGLSDRIKENEMNTLETKIIEAEYRRMKSHVRELESLNNITGCEYETEFTDCRKGATGFHASALVKVKVPK